jgi:hemolysin activation/secretion protein
VKEFEFSGNTVFTDAQLREITSPYRGREITSASVDALVRERGVRQLGGHRS